MTKNRVHLIYIKADIRDIIEFSTSLLLLFKNNYKISIDIKRKVTVGPFVCYMRSQKLLDKMISFGTVSDHV